MQYVTSPGSNSPCRYAATKSQRRIRKPRRPPMALKSRSEPPRIAAQKVWS